MKWFQNTLERFGIPYAKTKSDDMDVVVGAAKRVILSPEGEILMRHLIDKFELDEMTACLPLDESNWKNGSQAVVKYILGLTNDK
jgi:hypothetical protein